MKILVVGCGSVGSRHARNAAALTETAVFDTDAVALSRCADELGISRFGDMNEALSWGPDGVVVATPNHTHVPVALEAVRAGCHVMIEKPISVDLSEAVTLLTEAEKRGRSVHVVCNMRFHPAIRLMREHIGAVGTPLFVRAYYGNYLPDMRPGVDYRRLYCARRKEGGGVILDAIHEIDYLTWLFGDVERLVCHAGTLGDLDIDVEDYAVISLQHSTGVQSDIQLDYLRRFRRRGGELVGDAGTLLWRCEGKRPQGCYAGLYRPEERRWEAMLDSPYFDASPMYAELMRRFARIIEGKEASDLLTGEMGARVLAVALAARESSRTGRAVDLSNMYKALPKGK